MRISSEIIDLLAQSHFSFLSEQDRQAIIQRGEVVLEGQRHTRDSLDEAFRAPQFAVGKVTKEAETDLAKGLRTQIGAYQILDEAERDPERN